MHCWPRYLFILLIAVLGIGNMLTACGQKGPLYLPEPTAQQQAEMQAEADADTPSEQEDQPQQ